MLVGEFFADYRIEDCSKVTISFRELADAELESAIEVLSLNASRKSKVIEDIQQFLQV